MELELELTFLASSLPNDLQSFPHSEILDVYIPFDKPSMRIRKKDNKYEITKKIQGADASQQNEYTIPLSEAEYQAFLTVKGKKYTNYASNIPIKNLLPTLISFWMS
jgi:CYTH domain-containing protein